MTAVTYHSAAAMAIFRRDAALFLSYRMRLVSQVLSMIFSVTLFYFISRLVSIDSFASPDDYFEFVVIGLVILQAVMATLAMLPAAVRQELVAGTFEKLLLSPFGAVAGVLAMLVFPFIRAVVIGVVLIVFAMLAFGLEVEWPGVVLAFPAAALAALAFTPFSLLFTSAVIAFKQAPGAGFVIAGISLIAGVYFPVELLPNWIEWASAVQPFTPAVELMRHLLVGTELSQGAWISALKLVGFAAVLLPASVFVMRAALRFGQRRGTVTEY